MTKPKIIHVYFDREQINEIDAYVTQQKREGRKNAQGRVYSRNDFFIEASLLHAKELGLKINSTNNQQDLKNKQK